MCQLPVPLSRNLRFTSTASYFPASGFGLPSFVYYGQVHREGDISGLMWAA